MSVAASCGGSMRAGEGDRSLQNGQEVGLKMDQIHIYNYVKEGHSE